jgi:pyridoxal biosynthesis lyase PdxS
MGAIRTKRVTKTYKLGDTVIGGKPNGKPVDTVEVEFVTEGETLTLTKADFNQDIWDGMALYGGSYMISSDYEEALARLERLMEGHWASEQGKSGPRTGNIVEAVKRAKQATGQSFDAEAFKSRLVAMEDAERSTLVNQVLAIPEVQKEFNKIESEQLAARQAKRAALEASPNFSLAQL